MRGVRRTKRQGGWATRIVLILLINLARRADRLAWMKAQLAEQGLAFRRIEAVDGAGFPPMADFRGPMTNGEIACHLSHRRCWELLVKSGEAYALVLEDDLVLSPRTATILARPDLVPDGADLVRLETRRNEIGIRGASHTLDGDVSVHRMVTAHLGAAAYILSRSCAERLLAMDLSESTPVDHVLFDPAVPICRQLQIFQIDPGLGIQGDVLLGLGAPPLMASDIETNRRKRLIEHVRRRALAGVTPAPEPVLRQAVRRAKDIGRPLYNYLGYGVRFRRIEFDSRGAREPA
jgi:glycosyl transferase family 25